MYYTHGKVTLKATKIGKSTVKLEDGITYTIQADGTLSDKWDTTIIFRPATQADIANYNKAQEQANQKMEAQIRKFETFNWRSLTPIQLGHIGKQLGIIK